MTMTTLPNIVRLVNESDEWFRRKYGPVDRITIPPRGEIMVPEEVAQHYLGRWFLANTQAQPRARADEYTRLRAYYGAYEDAEAWERNRPTLAAYAADGSRITTVVDDPDGVMAGRDVGLNEEDQLSLMREQMNAMQARLDQADREKQANQAPPIEDDHQPHAPSPSPTIPRPAIGTLPDGTRLPIGPEPMPPVVDGVVEGDVDADGLPERMPVHAELVPMPPGAEGAQGAESGAGDVPDDEPTSVRVGSPLGGDE